MEALGLLKIARCFDGVGFFLFAGFGQEAEATLAPCEVDADIDECVGAPAGAHEGQDTVNDIGLSLHQRHRLTCDMVRASIHAEDEVAIVWIVGHKNAIS